MEISVSLPFIIDSGLWVRSVRANLSSFIKIVTINCCWKNNVSKSGIKLKPTWLAYFLSLRKAYCETYWLFTNRAPKNKQHVWIERREKSIDLMFLYQIFKFFERFAYISYVISQLHFHQKDILNWSKNQGTREYLLRYVSFYHKLLIYDRTIWIIMYCYISVKVYEIQKSHV